MQTLIEGTGMKKYSEMFKTFELKRKKKNPFSFGQNIQKNQCMPRRQLMLFCVKIWSEGNNNSARSGRDVRDRKQTQHQSPSARSTLEVRSHLDVPKTRSGPGGTAVKSTTAAARLQVFSECPPSI